MKKLFSLLLCLGVMLSCAVCVSADNVTTVEIVSPVEEVKPGQEITFEVYISAAEEFTSSALVLEYDQSVFQILGGECYLDDAVLGVFDKTRGLVCLFEEPTVVDGVAGVFTMKVKDGAASGETQIGGTYIMKRRSAELLTEVIPVQLNIITGTVEQNPEELKPAQTIPATEAEIENEAEVTQSTEPVSMVQDEVAPVETVPEQTVAKETVAAKPEAETQPQQQTEAPVVQPALPQKPAAEKSVPTELIIAVAVLVVLVGALFFCCVKLSKNKKTKK